MLEQIRSQLEAEITGLMHELSVELPERIKIAMEHGDLRENAEFKAAKERQGFVEARLNHLTTRMTELSKIVTHRHNPGVIVDADSCWGRALTALDVELQTRIGMLEARHCRDLARAAKDRGERAERLLELGPIGRAVLDLEEAEIREATA